MGQFSCAVLGCALCTIPFAAAAFLSHPLTLFTPFFPFQTTHLTAAQRKQIDARKHAKEISVSVRELR